MNRKPNDNYNIKQSKSGLQWPKMLYLLMDDGTNRTIDPKKCKSKVKA